MPQYDLRSVGLFCGKKYHKKFQLHSGVLGRRYEVLNIRDLDWMKKPHINIVHYMSKTASLGYEGEFQSLFVEFVIATISIILTAYGFLYQWDLLIPIFILPAIFATLAFCHSLYLILSDRFSKNVRSDDSEA